MKKTIIFIIIVLFSFNACETEQIEPDDPIDQLDDYRDQFYGDYSFNVRSVSWQFDWDSLRYDTTIYNGVIRKFVPDDENNNLFAELGTTTNPNEVITIEFLSYRKITSVISEDGVLTDKSGYHYYHTGMFTHLDTIKFKITGLGGQGGGCSYYVTGVRIR